MDNQKDLYREEAYELLTNLEDSLIELEQLPEDLNIVGKVFRAMHTIKGSGAMFGFDDIASFTHTIETIYDLIRDSKLKVTADLISLTLASCDQIRAMLGASQGLNTVSDAKTSELTLKFKAYLSPEEGSPEKATDAPAIQEDHENASGPLATYRIRFRPHKDLFANGTNPIPLLNELAGLGRKRGHLPYG